MTYPILGGDGAVDNAVVDRILLPFLVLFFDDRELSAGELAAALLLAPPVLLLSSRSRCLGLGLAALFEDEGPV